MANSKRIVTGSTEAIVDVLGILLLRPKKPFKGSFSKPPPGVAHPLAVGDGSELGLFGLAPLPGAKCLVVATTGRS